MATASRTSFDPALLEALRTEVPRAERDRPLLAGEGWDVTAWRVPSPDGDWLLRIPRHVEAGAVILAQHHLTLVLERHALPVPHESRVLHDAAGAVIGGLYRYVEGTPARVKGRTARTRLANEIAQFLTALHAIDTHEVEGLGNTRRNPWREEYAPMVARVLPHLGPATARWVRRRTDDMEEMSLHLPPPVLLHADLKPDHVLLSPDGQIAGILDFEGVQISDPAMDFGRLIQHWDRRFAAQVMTQYRHAVDEHFMERAQCYRDLEAVQTIDVSLQRGWTEWLPWAHRDLRARAAAAGRQQSVRRYPTPSTSRPPPH